MRRFRVVRSDLGVALMVLGLACENGPGSRRPSEVSVAGGSAPREVRVDARLLAAVEAARGVSPERARELVSEDALVAGRLTVQQPGLAHSLERLALARALLGSLQAEASRGGPATDAEVEQLTSARFWELDRPRMVQVQHAVVLSASESEAALDLAERIRGATAGARNAEEFAKSARSVPSLGLTVKVETLLPVAADGRAMDPDHPPPGGPPVQHYVLDFAQAAQRLEREGQLSGVLRTSFGYHVMRAQRIVLPQQLPLDERRKKLQAEVVEQRARALSAEILERQRREAVPEQMRSALASLEGLSAGGDSADSAGGSRLSPAAASPGTPR
jgi:hypothetical protein